MEIKRFLSVIILFLFTITLSASSTRVNSLGFGWLVPDEEQDITYNPAYINMFNGGRLFFYFGYMRDRAYSGTYGTNYNNWSSYLNIFIPFNQYKLGVSYAPGSYWQDNEPTYGIDYISDSHLAGIYGGVKGEGATCLGVRIARQLNNYQFNTGLVSTVPGIFSLNSAYNEHYVFDAGIVIGINERFSMGVVASGTVTSGREKIIDIEQTVYSEREGKSYNFRLLPEFRWAENVILRSYHSIYYSDFKNIKPDEMMNAFNYTGESLSSYHKIGIAAGDKKDTVFFLGSDFGLRFYQNEEIFYRVSGDSRSEKLSVYDGTVSTGFETRPFSNILVFRVRYNILNFAVYNSEQITEGIAISKKYPYTEHSEGSFTLLPSFITATTVGLGYKFGENLLADLYLSGSLYEGKRDVYKGPGYISTSIQENMNIAVNLTYMF